MKKIRYFKLLPAFFALLIALQSNAVVYQSVSGGGQWGSSSTWAPLGIPTSGDTVIINPGTVVTIGFIIYGHQEIFTSQCEHITIAAGGTLTGIDYGGGTATYLLQTKDLVNYGTINNSNEMVQISISGDFHNYGHYRPSKTWLSGQSNQNFFLDEGSVLGGFFDYVGSGHITMLSNLVYDGKFTSGGTPLQGHFNMKKKNLFIDGYYIKSIETVIHNGNIQGNFQIKGTFKVNYSVEDTLRFTGNITVTDTLQANDFGGGTGIQHLLVNGNIINNGHVIDQPQMDDRLCILISGNIINNGTWSCYYLKFTATDNQSLTQAENCVFQSRFYVLNPANTLLALSPITNTQTIALQGATLDMQGFELKLHNEISGGQLKNAVLHGGYIHNITAIENLVIKDKVSVREGNEIHCPLTITDTLQCDTYGGGTWDYYMIILNSVTNNGVIQSFGSGRLNLKISGDIANYGQWNNFKTILEGNQHQSIFMEPGHIFNGDFHAQKSAGEITALSNLAFTGSFNLGGGLLNMDNHCYEQGNWLYNGTVKHALIGNLIVQNISFTHHLTITGTLKVNDFNTIDCPVSIEGELISDTFGGGSKHFDLEVNDNITNNGTIASWGSGLLRIFAKGHLLNNGTWQNHLTYLNGENEQIITLMDNKPISSATQFDAVINAAPFQWFHNDNPITEGFNGTQAKVLIWSGPVESSMSGTFKCQTAQGFSRNIILTTGFTPVAEMQSTPETILVYYSTARQSLIIKSEVQVINADLFSISGKHLAQFRAPVHSSIPVSLIPGVYIVRLSTPRGYLTRKFVAGL